MGKRRIQKIQVPEGMDKHHRLPRSKGGNSSAGNISVVPINEHRAWHRLFGNKTPEEIARIISNVWIEPKFYMIVVLRKQLVRGKRGKQ